jgi:serine/threonine protein kinase
VPACLRRHPNIVDVKEVVVDRTYQKVYMVMEYADHDLKSLMEVRASACIALNSVWQPLWLTAHTAPRHP